MMVEMMMMQIDGLKMTKLKLWETKMQRSCREIPVSYQKSYLTRKKKVKTLESFRYITRKRYKKNVCNKTHQKHIYIYIYIWMI